MPSWRRVLMAGKTRKVERKEQSARSRPPYARVACAPPQDPEKVAWRAHECLTCAQELAARENRQVQVHRFTHKIWGGLGGRRELEAPAEGFQSRLVLACFTASDRPMSCCAILPPQVTSIASLV